MNKPEIKVDVSIEGIDEATKKSWKVCRSVKRSQNAGRRIGFNAFWNFGKWKRVAKKRRLMEG